MSKLINLSNLTRFWTKVKNYVDTALTGKAAATHGHSYNDLSDKPTIPSAYSHPASHPASMITGLSTVATSNSYNDLDDKPTIPAAYSHPTSHPASMITGLSAVATSGNYSDLAGAPTVPTTVAQLSDAGNYALKSDISAVYNLKGSKATYAELPTTGNKKGDVWDIVATGMNYVWTGTAWDALGAVVNMETATDAEIDALFA